MHHPSQVRRAGRSRRAPRRRTSRTPPLRSTDSNCDPRVEVNPGTFRPDLFYRLHILRLLIPPLRERREVDRILSDEQRAARSRDSWKADLIDAMRAVDAAMFELVDQGKVMAGPVLEYHRDERTALEARYSKIDAELQSVPALVCAGYVLIAMAEANDEMKDLLIDIPNWRDAMGEGAFRATSDADVESKARGLADAVTDICESMYKPVLRIVYRITLRKYGKAPPKKEPEMLGQLAGALRDMWKADPNHYTPIDELIYDDAIFVRNGVAHRTVRFDPKTNELVVTNKTVTREFTVDELAQILAGLYKRVKPMWLVLLKHSGKLDEEKELVGLSQAAP